VKWLVSHDVMLLFMNSHQKVVCTGKIPYLNHFGIKMVLHKGSIVILSVFTDVIFRRDEPQAI